MGMLKLGVALLAFGLFAACSDDPDPDLSGGPGGQGAGTSVVSGAGGQAGSTQAGSGGAGGTSTTAGAGGATAGSGAGTGGTTGGSAGAELEDGGMIDEGCRVGGVLYPIGASNIPAQDGCNTCACSASGLACTRIACPPDEGACVVAQRIDRCCMEWVAISRAEAEADPCIVALGEPLPSGQAHSACQPEVCTDVLCPEQGPPSRVAQRIGDGPCRFSDECNDNDDCVSAYDGARCCSCAGAWPASLVQQESCIVEQGETAAQACGAVCVAVLCGACPEPSEPSCSVRDSVSICQ